METCVILLGAGASFAYTPHLALMSNFACRAKANCAEHESPQGSDHKDYHCEFASRYRNVREFHDRLSNQNVAKRQVLKSHWKNLENLFTQLDLQRTLRLPRSRETFEDFTWVVWDTYCRFQSRPPYGRICDALIGKRIFPVFITTNYDLLLEWALWAHDMPTGNAGVGGKYSRFYYPGFQNFQSAQQHVIYFDQENNGRFQKQLAQKKNGGKWEIPIIKLHGSCSWFELEDGKWIGASSFFGQDRFLLNRFREDVSEVTRQEIVKPAIIPPLLSKSAIHDVIRAQWKAAVHHLSKAKYIVTVGYSFPVTDAFMKCLLIEGLTANNTLQRFQIVDKKGESEESRKGRYATVFDTDDNRVWVGNFKKGAKTFFKRLTNKPLKALSPGKSGDSCMSLKKYIHAENGLRHLS